MRRQRSLLAPRDRDHSAREGIDRGATARRQNHQHVSAGRWGVTQTDSGGTPMADESRSRLGRGLAALMGDVGAETATTPERARNQRRVPIEYLRPNPRNPRRNYADAEL